MLAVKFTALWIWQTLFCTVTVLCGGCSLFVGVQVGATVSDSPWWEVCPLQSACHGRNYFMTVNIAKMSLIHKQESLTLKCVVNYPQTVNLVCVFSHCEDFWVIRIHLRMDSRQIYYRDVQLDNKCPCARYWFRAWPLTTAFEPLQTILIFFIYRLANIIVYDSKDYLK